MLICWLGLKIISAFKSPSGSVGKIEQGFHIYETGTFLGCAGVSHAGEKGPSERPAEGGSGDYPLAQTGEKGKGEEGIKENSNPCL